MARRTKPELKQRADGTVNITLDGETVAELDKYIEAKSQELGFKLTRSQGVRSLIKTAGEK
jgi:hypothetical protein